jgi:hypothetical protein
MIQNKTEVLNLKSRKTQVPIGYLTLNIKLLILFVHGSCHFTNNF